jgi:hypothetical protein
MTEPMLSALRFLGNSQHIESILVGNYVAPAGTYPYTRDISAHDCTHLVTEYTCNIELVPHYIL